MRCKTHNNVVSRVVDNGFLVSGITANGFGNVDLGIRPPQPSVPAPKNYKKPWLTTSSTEGAYTFQLPRSITIEKGKTHPTEYLIYLPGVDAERPFSGQTEGSLSLVATPAGVHRSYEMYIAGSEAKTLVATKQYLSTTINIEEGLYNPVRYLPKTLVIAESKISTYGSPFKGITEADWNSFLSFDYSWDHTNRKKVTLANYRYYSYLDHLESGRGLGNFLFQIQTGPNAASYALITKMQYDALFPTIPLETVYTKNLNTEFQQAGDPYLARISPRNAIGVGGRVFYVQDDYYREPVLSFSPSTLVARNLLYGGEFQSKPLYALKYKPVSGYINSGTRQRLATHKGQVLRANSIRVAYRYTYIKAFLKIESRVIADDPSITSAKDLITNNTFARASEVTTRLIPFVGVMYQRFGRYGNSGRIDYLYYVKASPLEALTDPSVPASQADLLRIRDIYPPTSIPVLNDDNKSLQLVKIWASDEMGAYRYYRDFSALENPDFQASIYHESYPVLVLSETLTD